MRRERDALVVALSGTCHLRDGVPSVSPIATALDAGDIRQVRFDCRGLDGWDSGAVLFATRVTALADQHQVEVDRSGLPRGVQQLTALATEAGRAQTAPAPSRQPWLARVGDATRARGDSALGALAFVGDLTRGLGRLMVGRADFDTRVFFVQMQQSGARAMGIVSLVSFLVGLILAFVGSVQLKSFGAEIYVADLVGVAMVRDMAGVMTAVVVAGRTGAAFAAELGTMRVTQEVDALTTLGIAPAEYLVLPRLLGLTLMMPFLCVYAAALGVLGGAAVGVGMMGLRPILYFQQTFDAVTLTQFIGGVCKGTVYGALVGVAGCLEGLRCGRSAGDVGRATTAAVVDGIVLIIVACGVFAVLFYLVGM